MAFGNEIVNFVNAVPGGSQGYILKIDYDLIRIRKITEIAIKLASGAYLAPVSSPVASLSVLYGYVEDEDCPDVAFYQSNNIAFVFLKSDTIPYEAGYRIGIHYFRTTEKLSATTDKRDVPNEAITLADNIALRMARELKGDRTEFDITQSVIREKDKLGV